MKRIAIILFILVLSLSAAAQKGGYLYAYPLELMDINNRFKLPQKFNKSGNETDINENPFAMIEVVSKGFNCELLKDMKIFTESPELTLYSEYNQEKCLINIYLSANVSGGELVFRYHDSELRYPLIKLIGKRVYRMELSLRSANLTIVAKPVESRIIIDGEVVGEHGYASVDLRMGKHTYSVECEDYQDEKNIEIEIQENKIINIDLKPLFGYITIISDPLGAEVFVDDELFGITPCYNQKIQRGGRRIKITGYGYDDYYDYVDIDMKEFKEINVRLISSSTGTVYSRQKKSMLPTLVLSQDSVYFNSEHSMDSVFITTNSTDWDFQKPPSWLSVFKRNNVLYITCMKNHVRESREADITVFTNAMEKTVHVYQAIGKTVLRSNLNNIVFDADCDTVVRTIENNVTGWNIITSDDWIKAYEKDGALVAICDENTMPISRYGEIMVSAFDQEMRIDVAQKSHVTAMRFVENDGDSNNAKTDIDVVSRPLWSKIYIDERYAGRTPFKVAVDDSVHIVRFGRESRSFLFNNKQKKIEFNTGFRFIQATYSGSNIGVMGGFIGCKRMGFNGHFQFAIDNRDIMPDKGGKPKYYCNVGPMVEVLPWMLVYSGVGLSLTTDTIEQASIYQNESTISYVSEKRAQDIHIGCGFEVGLMFYIRNVIISGGYQYYKIGKDGANSGFSIGLGTYFNRDNDKIYGYRIMKDGFNWSLNYVYNATRNGHGLMFGHLGSGIVQAYIKPMIEHPSQNEFDMGISLGAISPGYISIVAGVGYQVYSISSVIGSKGFEAEGGVIVNLWRFPLSLMMRICEIEKSERYMCVDFGIGFKFN